ncbi:UDP-glucose 4-epimerase GalE [Polaromonas sp. YR568]|uniref:UDP-glucose 4-epimerase GalE n=1 Tax=Polaromonas sp. YR568 TaxID=1855301 RepID=UPI00398BEB7F
MNAWSQTTLDHRTVLVTGAAGYIGSHTVTELLRQGCRVVALDNYCNSSPEVYRRIEGLAGTTFAHVEADVRDGAALEKVLSNHDIDACIHFAALKSVSDSIIHPLRYLDNNVRGLLVLLRVLQRYHVHRFVFSSSATVYGDPVRVPVAESAVLNATSVYGATKLMGEDILRRLAAAPAELEETWRVAALRYFNPVGAHPSGQIGEEPLGIPNNLMPYVMQVAAGLRPKLSIFGGDYPTPDGTCVRDYIHIQDLVEGHLAALKHLLDGGASLTVNLGTGRGTSVRQLVETFVQVNGVTVPYEFAARRPGDVAQYFADPSRARELLGWQARHDLADMCRDAWRWQCSQPQNHA